MQSKSFELTYHLVALTCSFIFAEKSVLGHLNPAALENAEQSSLAEREESVRSILFPLLKIVGSLCDFVKL